MNGEKFDLLAMKVEDLLENDDTPFTEGYYPTVEELEGLRVRSNIEGFLPILIFFSNDPYAGDPDISRREDYRTMVKYLKSMLYKYSMALE